MNLTDLGLRHTTEYIEITSDSIVIDQFQHLVLRYKRSIIDLYLILDL